jgi:hypothetical protein
LTEDELADDGRLFDPRAVNLNLESIASRFLDCGSRLWAAYGSLASPPGGKCLLYTVAGCRLGLTSRDAGTEVSFVAGPIEKAPWCFPATIPLESPVEWLVGPVVVAPDDPGLESLMLIDEGEAVGGDTWGVTVAASSTTFCKDAALAFASAVSMDRDAAGVIGGECNGPILGLRWGDRTPIDVPVLCRLASRELSSFEWICQKQAQSVTVENIKTLAKQKGTVSGRTIAERL